MDANYLNSQLKPGEYTTTDTNLSKFIGQSIAFPDLDYSLRVPKARTPRIVKRMLVKNSAGFALLPKRIVTFKVGTDYGEVDGYARTSGQSPVAVVDEWLDAAGVPDGGYFWVTVEGPTAILLSAAASAQNVVAAGAHLVALTAVTSGATTAGRVITQVLTGATDVLAAQIQGLVAVAMTAATTDNTEVLSLVTNSYSF